MKRDLMQAVEYSHELLKEHLQDGKLFIDATAGNGYDTCFLARLAGDHGQVFAFDIQIQAIEQTKAKLEQLGLEERVTLIHDSHVNIKKHVDQMVDGTLFNLGYLPGGDKGVVTQAPETLLAVQQSLKILKPGGLVVMVIYAGHAGGENELSLLLEFAKGLDKSVYNVLRYQFINQPSIPPQVLAIKKRLKR